MEIVAVIALISILIVGLSSTFSDRSTIQKYQWEECFTQIDWEVQNFIQSALFGKSLTPTVFPDYYVISLNKTADTIDFKYRMLDGSSGSFKKVNLSNFCSGKWIWFYLTGSFFSQWLQEIIINKWLRQLKPWELSVFSFSWTSTDVFTWDIYLNMCGKDQAWTSCPKEFAKRSIDRRVHWIFAQKCLLYTQYNWIICSRREGETHPDL